MGSINQKTTRLKKQQQAVQELIASFAWLE